MIILFFMLTFLIKNHLCVKQFEQRPNWLKICDKVNPNENNCFRDMFQEMFPHILKGIPEFDIPKFDPLELNEIKVHRTTDQTITLEGSFDNLRAYGASNSSITQAYLNLDKKLMNFKMEMPKLILNSTYNLKGNILLLPLHAQNGYVKILLKNVKTIIISRFSIKNLPEEAMNIEEMKVLLNIGGLRIHFDNLFNDNKAIAASFHMFINQNSKEIFNILKQELEHELSKILREIWNSIFNKFPIKLWLN